MQNQNQILNNQNQILNNQNQILNNQNQFLQDVVNVDNAEDLFKQAYNYNAPRLQKELDDAKAKRDQYIKDLKDANQSFSGGADKLVPYLEMIRTGHIDRYGDAQQDGIRKILKETGDRLKQQYFDKPGMMRTIDADAAFTNAHGLSIVDRTAKKLLSKVRNAQREKRTVSLEMLKVRRDYVPTEAKINKCDNLTDKDIKKSYTLFKKFSYSKLGDYKKDKDFIKNHTSIMQKLTHQIEEGYAARKYYYELMEKGEEKDCLKAMAKTAVLERVRDYMDARAVLIQNPYYSACDTDTFFSMEIRALGQRLDDEQKKQPADDNLVEYLASIYKIRSLGFKQDGSGRSDLEKNIMASRQRIWAQERNNVHDYSLHQRKIEDLERRIKANDTDYKIEMEKAEIRKKEREEAENKEKEKKENAIRERVLYIKKNRGDFFKRMGMILNTLPVENISEALKDNVLKHIAESVPEIDTTPEKIKDAKFLRLAELFKVRINEKMGAVDSLVNSPEYTKLTFGLDSRKTMIKNVILRDMLNKDELLKADDKYSLKKYTEINFTKHYENAEMKARYDYIALEFPYLVSDKKVWGTLITQTLLESGQKDFKREIDNLKEQAGFNDMVLRSLIDEAVKEEKIHINVRELTYNRIKERLKAKLYVANANELVLEVSGLLENAKSLHISDEKKSGRGNQNPPAQSNIKWSIENLKDPVVAIRTAFAVKMKDILAVFGTDDYMLGESMLRAMKENSAAVKACPPVASLNDAQELSTLSYKEIRRLVDIVCDTVRDSMSLFAAQVSGQSDFVKKQVMSKMMTGVMKKETIEDSIKEAVTAAKKEEQRIEAERRLDEDILMSEFGAKKKLIKKIDYNYLAVEGSKSFQDKIFGIQVREASFKAPKRIERAWRADSVWKEINEKGRTEAVLKDLVSGKAFKDIPDLRDYARYENEIRLCGAASELFKIGGQGEKVMQTHSDDDYKNGIKRLNYVSKFMLDVEALIKPIPDKSFKNAVRAKCRKLVSDYRSVDGIRIGTREYDVAIKYNEEHFGHSTAWDALAAFMSRISDEHGKIDTAKIDEVKALGEKKDVALQALFDNESLRPILPYLVEQKRFKRELYGKSEDDVKNEIAPRLKAQFAPFLEAFNDKGQLPYIAQQYLANNFDTIFQNCTAGETKKGDWVDAIEAYEKQLFKVKIEGRGSIGELLNKVYDYAGYKKKGGKTILIFLMQVHPELFTAIIEEKEGVIKDKIDKYFKNYDKQLKTIGDYLSKIGEKDERGEAASAISNMAVSVMFSDALLKKQDLDNYYADYRAEKAAREDRLAKQNKGERTFAFNTNAERLKYKKKRGFENDLDLGTLISVNDVTIKSPYIYLYSKGKLSDKKPYTANEAKDSRATIDKALEKMKHTDELPEALKNFMAEVAFAGGMDIYKELVYIIGLYRSVKLYYKLGKSVKYKEADEAVIRATIYHYTKNQNHEITEAMERVYKHRMPAKVKQVNIPANQPAQQGNQPAQQNQQNQPAQQGNQPVQQNQQNQPAQQNQAQQGQVQQNQQAQQNQQNQQAQQNQQNQQNQPAQQNQQNQQNQPVQQPQQNLSPQEIERKSLLEYFGHKDRLLTDEQIAVLRKYKKEREEAKKKEEEQKEKSRKEEEKKLKELEKWEDDNKEYVIALPDMDRVKEGTDDFDKVYRQNLALQERLNDNKIKDPSLKAEYKFFLKNIQLMMYKMKADEFIKFTERRVRYFEYADSVYALLKKKIESHDKANPHKTSDVNKTIERNSKANLEGARDYFKEDILNVLKDETAVFNENLWNNKINELLDDKETYDQIGATKISFDDELGRGRFMENQERFSDVLMLIGKSQEEDALKQVRSLDRNEQLLFAAVLSLASPEEISPDQQAGSTNYKTGSAGIIEKDGNAGYGMALITAALEKYMAGESFDLEVDYRRAIYNLIDEKESERSGYQRLINYDKKPVLNKKAFDAAMAMVTSIRDAKNAMSAPDLKTLGDPSVSLEYARLHNMPQAIYSRSANIEKMGSFAFELTRIAMEDEKRVGNQGAFQNVKSRAHQFYEGVSKNARADLIKRLLNMPTEEQHLFVMIMQDRTILDFRSENRDETFLDGGLIEHVNATKRAMIKDMYLAGPDQRAQLLKPASRKGALKDAFNTLLSFQLRDGVSVDGTRDDHFLDSSLHRTTILDWELIKRCFDFIDEIREDNARINAVKSSSDWIEYSGNEKAISALEQLPKKKEEIDSFNDDKFLEFFEKDIIKNELNAKQKMLLDGFRILSPAKKTLFFRALQSRDVLDISKRDSVKNLVLGTERTYVNKAGRYALIDEYLERSASDNSKMDETPMMRYQAMKTLLSTRIDDSRDFLKAGDKKIDDLFVREKDRKKTAIDWKLFENCLQFVERAENERKIAFEDAALYRTLGDLEENGQFVFDPKLLRRNLHQSHGRFKNYVASRIRKRVKGYIPDTGNLRYLLKYVLNVNAMNAVNKSGWLPKKGTTGEINQKYANSFRAEKIREDYKKTSEKLANGKVELLLGKVGAAKEEYERMDALYQRAKAEDDPLLEDIKRDRERALQEYRAAQAELAESEKLATGTGEAEALWGEVGSAMGKYQKMETLYQKAKAENSPLLEDIKRDRDIALDEYKIAQNKIAKKSQEVAETEALAQAQENKIKSLVGENALNEMKVQMGMDKATVYDQRHNFTKDNPLAGVLITDPKGQKIEYVKPEDEYLEELPQEKENAQVNPEGLFTNTMNFPTIIRPMTDIAEFQEKLRKLTDLGEAAEGGQRLYLELKQFKGQKLFTFTVTTKTKNSIEKDRLFNLRREIEKLIRKEENEANATGTCLNEDELTEILKDKLGFSQYTGILQAITNSVGINSQDNRAAQYIDSIQKLNDSVMKSIAMFKSDKKWYQSLLYMDLDALMGMASLIADDVKLSGEFKKVRSWVEDVQKIQGDLRNVVDSALSDTDIWSKLTETEITGVFDVIRKHKNYRHLDLIQKTVGNLQNIGGNINQLFRNFAQESFSEKDGKKKDFLDYDKDVMEQLGVGAAFDILHDCTVQFKKSEYAGEIINSTKEVVRDAGKIVADILKQPKMMALVENQISETIAKYDLQEKLIKEEMGKETDPDKVFEMQMQLDALENEKKLNLTTLKKAQKMAKPNEIASIIEDVNLADIGKLVNAIAKNEKGEMANKVLTQINAVKDQAAQLYKLYMSSANTSDFLAQLSFDKLVEGGNMMKKGSYWKMTTRFAAGGANLLKNGFRIGLKLTNTKEFLMIGNDVIRLKGEGLTEKKDKYGDLQTRKVKDILNQFGVDEMFEISKTVSLLDPTGKSTKYITSLQNVKTQVAKFIDNVTDAQLKSGYEQFKVATDVDGCLEALEELFNHSEVTRGSAEAMKLMREANALKTQITDIYEAMAKDGDFCEKLYDLNIEGLLDLAKSFDKNGFIGVMRDVVSETKKIYNASYGLYTQGAGIYLSLKNLFTNDSIAEFKANKQKIMASFGKNSFIGDKLKSLEEGGSLDPLIKTGMVVKENLNNFVSIFKASGGLVDLAKGRGNDERQFADVDDYLSMLDAFDEQDSQLKGSDGQNNDGDFKLSKAEKKLVEDSRDRNLFMTDKGRNYAIMDESMQIVGSLIEIAGSTAKVTFDPTGLTAGAAKELAAFVKYVATLLVDRNAFRDYFLKGPGKEKLNELKQLKGIPLDEHDKDGDLFEAVRTACGFSDDFELRTFVGRNIVNSILFSASPMNPLKGTRMRAESILKALGLSDLIGQVNESAAVKLFNTLLGNYGVDLDSEGDLPQMQEEEQKIYRD